MPTVYNVLFRADEYRVILREWRPSGPVLDVPFRVFADEPAGETDGSSAGTIGGTESPVLPVENERERA